jgi:transcriptional regulator with XRE-family HTH domain
MRKSPHTREYQRLIRELRQVREESGVTQEEAATRLGTYASFISKVESCERRIDVLELKIFCELYRIDLVEFLRRAGVVG